MIGWLKSLFGRRRQPQRQVVIRAKYDNAQPVSSGLWNGVDSLSAKAANSLPVRQKLRDRSRYELANNCYAGSIVRTSAKDLISTGPSLEVLTTDKKANAQIEAAFTQWALAVALTEKLYTIALAKRGDGEGFFVLQSYSKIDSPVQLYPRDVECDQFTTPALGTITHQRVDGVILDEIGKPELWHLLQYHPGDDLVYNPLAYREIPARYVLHWFRKDRPGQVRGIPEITPALELFGEMRRYRRAVLGAAETAASIAAFLKTIAPSADGDVSVDDAFSTMDIERDVMLTLPANTDIGQLKAEQPTTTFDAFIEKLLAEACRTLNVPLNIALGTSQKFNFSSARLDHASYHDSLRVERQECERVVLDPLLRAWLDEAIMIPGLLPAGLDIANLPYAWHWPGFAWLDPLTDAKADTERLTVNRTMTYARFYASRGLDWEDEFEQLAAEKREMQRLGLTTNDVAKAATGDPDEAQEEAAQAA